MRVKMLDGEEVIDTGVICDIGENDHGRPKIRVRSQRFYPGQITEFGLLALSHGVSKWCMLFEDPFTGDLCYSQRGPSYDFVPA